MFWKLRMQPASALDDLLASDNCTLEEVLDEENVVDELRSNRALLDFLTRQDILPRIISLVVEEPPDDLEESIRYKRPHVACNLFSLEQGSSNALADSVVADESLLDRLWSFLESPSPLNPLLASFFSRVLLSILQRKAVVVIEYLSSRDKALDQLLEHIDTSAIMDFLLGMLTACDTVQLRRDLIQWFRDAQLIKLLIDLVHPSIDEDKQRNAARTLSELIRLCYDHLARSSDVVQSDQLLDILEHDDTIQQLLHNIFVESGTSSSIVRGVSVLQAMLTLQQGLTEQGMTDSPVVANEEAARQVVASLTPWLASFHRVLLEPPTSPAVVTTVGTISVPVGPARLGIVQLLLLCLQCNVADFVQEFIRLNVGATLLDMFLQYMWNNFLHTQVEQIVLFAFSAKPEEGATVDGCLPLSLLASYRLTEKLAAAGMENDKQQREPRGRRRGYMGHVVNMCNTILQTMENDEQIANIVNTMSKEEGSVWREWVEGGLAATNERNNSTLGGQQPIDDDVDEMSMETLSTSDNIHQAFMNYQSEQLSTEFADSFGFDEEELGFSEPPVTAPYDEAAALDFELVADLRSSDADLFKNCCESRIEQFGAIPESDENWKQREDEAASSQQQSVSDSDARVSENVDDTQNCPPGVSSDALDDAMLDAEDDMDEAIDNFQFLTSGLMKKSVDVSDIRADAEAAMKEFEEVTGIAST